MIPEERFSSDPQRGQLLNPWSRDRKIAYHWGPVQLSDTSQGLLVKLWTLRAEGGDAVLSAPGSPTVTLFTRAADIDNVNLAFDQNGRASVCFEEEGGGAYLWWFDPVPSAPTFTLIPGDAVSPRITLDDARQFNIPNSDIILGYVRDGVVRYRRQRDRFTVEYTPLIGQGGGIVEHTPFAWSMSSGPYAAGLDASTENMRDGEFTTGGAPGDSSSAWIKADLGEPKTVEKVQVAGGNLPVWGPVSSFLNGRFVQYSNDDSSWTTVVTVTGATDSAPYVSELSFSPVTARYWRLTNIGADSWLAATEFRLYGEVAGDGRPATATALRHISMNSNLRLEFLTGGGGSEDWTLADVVEEICHRAGLDAQKTRVTQLYNDIVRGFTTSVAHPAHGSLQALSQVFFFNPANVGGRVEFVKMGGPAVAMVSEDEMIDDATDVEADSRRGDSIGIPRVLHLNYYDVQGGLNTDKQHSERPEGTRAEGEVSLQTAVVLSHDEAATIVARNHAMMAESQKGELHVPLPDNYLFLTESDPIHVQYEGKVVRGVISEAVVMDGEQRYKVIRDRQSIHTMDVQGIPPAPVTKPPSSVVGPTLLEVLDIPIVRDSDDALGAYIAVSGIMPAWQGALVELSMDGGETYIESHTVRADTIMGTLASALDDHPAEFPDEVNSCQVNVPTPYAVLEGTDLRGMMNRRNLALIGDELVNFSEADEVSEGVWKISHFLRGRRGTETQAHIIGERFAMLSGAIFVPAEMVMLDRPITVRATSLGTDNETIVALTFTGQSQVERRPAYLQARRDGSNIVASWQGVGRIGGGTHVAMGQHFAGYRVTVTDGTTTQTHNTAESEFTGSLSAFSGPVTVRVQQRNNFTGLGPAIEVTI